MAMAGAGCRAAASANLVRPSAFLSLLSCRATTTKLFQSYPSCDRIRNFSSASLSKQSWRPGFRQRFFGRVLRLGGEEGGSSSGKGLSSSQQQRFFVKAIDVSGPGAVDSPLMQSMRTKIQEDLDAESVTVKDAYGDGRHVSIDVVASVFEGKSAVNRQRMVYKAIWQELQETVHAVDQLKTRTPSEAANSPDQL